MMSVEPYNPIVGETFRYMWLHQKTSSKTFYIAEQVMAASNNELFQIIELLGTGSYENQFSIPICTPWCWNIQANYSS